jgi:hypothetical protein
LAIFKRIIAGQQERIDVVNDGEMSKISYKTERERPSPSNGRDESDPARLASHAIFYRLSGEEKEETYMKTIRVYRLNNLSPTLLRRLKAAQMEAARVWNLCVQTHKAARVTHAQWPGQRELEQATKGRFALNAQAVQQIVHAFLANVKTTHTLHREHPEMRMKYPWREKRCYPVKWPAQAVHREEGRVVLPMGKGHPSLMLPLALPENAGACTLHIQALNQAVRDIPPDRLRLHLCWGNYEGPHHRDSPLRTILPDVLEARPVALSFEGANPRHEHEWRVFEEVKLPEGKIIMPGVLDSTTNFIEHTELVAQRIERYASVVGRERVIAGTDCGFATFSGALTVDPDITWAKLAAMVEGAQIASGRLWPSS